VRTNLHLVLTELQNVARFYEEHGEGASGSCPDREHGGRLRRELRTVHDLLFRPQESPEEEVLEAILASLAAALRELADLLARLPDPERSQVLRSNLRACASSRRICGECVPAPTRPAQVWMDKIRDLAGSVA